MPGMALGRTGIVGPDGLTLAETGRHAGTVVAEIDLDRPRLVRSFGVGGQADFRHELWRHRRPETYAALATGGAHLEQTGTAPAVAPTASSSSVAGAAAGDAGAEEPRPAGLSSGP
jgi:hypothetical protein